MTQKDVCGEETYAGNSCGRPAGWGRDEDTGPCKDHVESKNQEIKNIFIEILENEVISIQKAAKKAGREQSTIWKWRQQDPEFNQRFEEARNKQDDKRLAAVEDSMFKRILQGDAAASEVIFWLKNRGRHRWADRVEQSIQVDDRREEREEIDEFIEIFDQQES